MWEVGTFTRELSTNFAGEEWGTFPQPAWGTFGGGGKRSRVWGVGTWWFPRQVFRWVGGEFAGGPTPPSPEALVTFPAKDSALNKESLRNYQGFSVLAAEHNILNSLSS